MTATSDSAMLPDARLSVVVLTYNRAEQVLDTLAKLTVLPDDVRIVVVDNASRDGMAERIAQRFPGIALVRAPRNLGAAGRNLGVAHVTTEYVAFCDDDTWWNTGALARAVDILDTLPSVAVINARVVVGENGSTDDTCKHMRDSPLSHDGLPGRALIGFMADACVFRTDVFRRVGGYEPRLFIGGEETLVSLDVLALGYAMVYCDDLVLHHHPSPLRDSRQRRLLLARNAAWIAWMRLLFYEALQATPHAFQVLWTERAWLSEFFALSKGIVWALLERRTISSDVQEM